MKKKVILVALMMALAVLAVGCGEPNVSSAKLPKPVLLHPALQHRSVPAQFLRRKRLVWSWQRTSKKGIR